MRKRLWDLAKSRIEIGTILPGHRHKVAPRERVSKDSVANFPRRKTSGAAASIDIDAAVAAHHDEFAFPM